MKGSRDIKRRLRGIQSTAKITRAMQLVASSKMRHAQRAAINARRYTMHLAQMADHVMRLGEGIPNIFLQQRPIYHRGILLISTDKGLCGSLNQNTFRLLRGVESSARFIAVGKKGAQYLVRQKRDLLGQFSVSDRVQFAEIRGLADFLKDLYLREEVDSVEVIFPLFVSTMHQEPMVQKLLPINDIGDDVRRQAMALNEAHLALPKDERQLLVEPSVSRMMNLLPEAFFRQSLYHILLEAKAAEQSARMVAMKTATDNAKELARQLSLEYNKARQAAITNEIIEITAASVEEMA